MSDKLLPCPFCGGEAEIACYGDRSKSTIYQCTRCSCSLETGEEWDHGTDWNRRSNPSHAQLAAARSALEKAATWLEGWASAEPYLSEIRSALSTLAQEPAGQSEAKCDCEPWPDNCPYCGNGSPAHPTAPAGSASPCATATPVAWRLTWSDGANSYHSGSSRPKAVRGISLTPLYAHPTVKVSVALVDALKNARSMLTAFGGDPRKVIAEHGSSAGDEIQAALLDQIDSALAAHPTVKVSGDAAEMRERAARVAEELVDGWDNIKNEPKKVLRWWPDGEAIAAEIRSLPLTPEGRS